MIAFMLTRALRLSVADMRARMSEREFRQWRAFARRYGLRLEGLF